VRILPLDAIRRCLDYPAIIDRMRAALIAYSRGECDTPMPMHLDIPAHHAEVHMKSSYRRGGSYFALKIAATFPENTQRGLPVGNGMMLLASAETGEPIAFLADAGHLTDVRTAAVAAMTARELGRRDTAIGILGTGTQARISAMLHAESLRPDAIVIWGRSRERAEACAREIRELGVRNVEIAHTPAEVARACRLIVTCTASREPLLLSDDIQPDTHISAVGADSPGKQELDAAILRRAELVLADSRQQCQKLGELQHAPDLWDRAVEIGEFCERPCDVPLEAITVADFTGLGVEDLYIAEYVYERVLAQA
jgi:ornithine cyclodeaminase/alanine dehydrogenase-like protein (mu-crystallin family)